MFRVYFFNPVTLRKDKKREKNEEEKRTHLVLSSLPLVFLYHLYFFCTHCDTSLESGDSHRDGCKRALCLESSRTRRSAHLLCLHHCNKTEETIYMTTEGHTSNATTGSLSSLTPLSHWCSNQVSGCITVHLASRHFCI